MPATANTKLTDDGPVGVGAYIALILVLLFFSGLFYNLSEHKWLGAFDFTTLAGAFGKIAGSNNTYMGAGGVGARAGFLFALSLVPSVMLALGILEVATYYGAIRAAQRLMTPLLRPVLGVPGLTGLALITDLQSTDAGAALTKGLNDQGYITKKELVIMCSWQYAGAGLIGNYFSTAGALFPHMVLPVIVPLLIMFVLKFVGGAFVRTVLNTFYRKDFANA